MGDLFFPKTSATQRVRPWQHSICKSVRQYICPMHTTNLNELLGNTDIYLLDQMMKGRYKPTDKILDAGCGGGRNLHWFLNNGFDVFGVDLNEDNIDYLKQSSNLPDAHFTAAAVEKMPFDDNFFDHIISSAVLHFANGTQHFIQMMSEMVRVLKPGGSLFIRMTSDIGIENKVRMITEGVYNLPDGSTRFLLTKHLLQTVLQNMPLSFLEPFKTVNVNDIRCMSTLMLCKTG